MNAEGPALPPFERLSFERYFHWADQMRKHFEQRDYRDELPAHWEPYMAYWYGSLYAVIEGWRELRLSDPGIDRLLEAEQNVGLLRRYRNCAFHFQRGYFDSRVVDVWASDEAVPWIRSLHREFTRWFEEQQIIYARKSTE